MSTCLDSHVTINNNKIFKQNGTDIINNLDKNTKVFIEFADASNKSKGLFNSSPLGIMNILFKKKNGKKYIGKFKITNPAKIKESTNSYDFSNTCGNVTGDNESDSELESDLDSDSESDSDSDLESESNFNSVQNAERQHLQSLKAAKAAKAVRPPINAQQPKGPLANVQQPKEPLANVQQSKGPPINAQQPKGPLANVQQPKRPSVNAQQLKEPSAIVQESNSLPRPPHVLLSNSSKNPNVLLARARNLSQHATTNIKSKINAQVQRQQPQVVSQQNNSSQKGQARSTQQNNSSQKLQKGQARTVQQNNSSQKTHALVVSQQNNSLQKLQKGQARAVQQNNSLQKLQKGQARAVQQNNSLQKLQKGQAQVAPKKASDQNINLQVGGYKKLYISKLKTKKTHKKPNK